MMQNEILSTNLEAVGENIGHELGAKMVKDFQDQFPTENQWLFAGRKILEEILAQPNCAGIRFYNALDEKGEKTLVYVGIDNQNNIIADYTIVGKDGILTRTTGIVADRLNKPKEGTSGTSTTLDWWA